MTSEEGLRLKNKIKRMLLKESLSNKEVVESFHTKTRAKIVNLLTYLIDEGFIKTDNDNLTWADEKK